MQKYNLYETEDGLIQKNNVHVDKVIEIVKDEKDEKEEKMLITP